MTASRNNELNWIEFRPAKNDFERELIKKVETIKNETKVIVPGDKTSNFYKLEKEEYINLIEKNVHKEYKKARKEEVKHGVRQHRR